MSQLINSFGGRRLGVRPKIALKLLRGIISTILIFELILPPQAWAESKPPASVQTKHSNVAVEDLIGGPTSTASSGGTADPSSGKTKAVETVAKSMAMSTMSAPASAGAGGPQSWANNYHFDPYSGSGVLTLPLFSTPGRGKIAMPLTLSYSHRQGNGILGMGWGIDFGTIERSTKNGVPSYTDTDTFISTLGGDNSELVPVGNNEYRAKVQGGFVRFRQKESSWLAQDKQGTQYYFGLKDYLQDNSIEQTSSGQIFRWRLSKIKDVYGNYCYIKYFPDGGFEIRYTGEPGTDYAVYGSDAQKYQFLVKAEMEPVLRADPIVDYRGGYEKRVNYRVKSISTYAGPALQCKYAFDYQYSQRTGRSLLKKITTYGSDGQTALPPVAFSYAEAPAINYQLTTVGLDPTTGDNLYNVRLNGRDYFHSNEFILYPHYGSSPDQGVFSNGMVVDWSPKYTQSVYADSVRHWSHGAGGDFHYWGSKDSAFYAWTYLYVNDPKTISISSSGDVYHMFLNGNYATPRQGGNFGLTAGYNLLEVTGYNQNNRNFCDIYTALASQVDLMNSAQVVMPQLAGDFNADGLPDMATFFPDTGTVKVALSKGTVFLPKATWITNFAQGLSPLVGDFNSDGFVDMGAFDSSKGEWRVALSDGTKFTDAGVWLTNFGANQQPMAGDFNGDGWVDVAIASKEGVNLVARFALNQKTSFVPHPVAHALGSTTTTAVAADFNADGLSDFAVIDAASGTWTVRLNEGRLGVDFKLLDSVSGFGTGFKVLVSDFDSDGQSDIGYYDNNQGKVYYRAMRGLIFGAQQELPVQFGLRGADTQIQAADFNADGATDFAAYNNFGNLEIAFSGSPFADLLNRTNNGTGGFTDIAYASSASFANDFLPFVLPVVKSVKVSNAIGDTYSTQLSYSKGYFNSAEREFYGFGSVKVYDPDDNFQETKFLQNSIYLRGRVSEQAQYDKDGKIFAKGVNQWAVQDLTGASKFVFLKRKDDFVYEGTATAGRRKAAEYNYGEATQLGNLTRMIDWGEVDLNTGNDIGNDKRTVETEYLNKTTIDYWLFGFPKHVTIKNNADTVVRQAWLYYDYHTNVDDLPTKGTLTQKKNWGGSAAGAVHPISKYMYDIYGNLVITTDPLNRSSRVSYDSTYHMFPLRTTNALNYQISNEYYGINGVPLNSGDGFKGLWGQLKSSTDPNNQQGRTTYDVFGRPTATVSPLDSIAYPTTSAEYIFAADHSTIKTHQREKAGQPGTFDSVQFYDGLGRLIQTKTESALSGQFITSGQTEYTSRGLPYKKYPPFLSTSASDVVDHIDTTKSHATIEYDALGRVIRATNPDNTFASSDYGVLEASTINENGHKQKSYFDIFGRLIKKEEYSGADGRSPNYPAANYQLYAATQYSYDSEGNLTQVRDDQGNVTAIAYDALGRKISMDDPDMGIWQYGYDATGNMTRQIDAKNQQLVFRYDPLNRLVNKNSGSMLNVDYLYDDPAGGFSKGRLTKSQYSLTDNTNFVYDQLGREITSTKTIDAIGYTVRRTYDAASRLQTVEYPGGRKVLYEYNAAGQIIKVKENAVQQGNFVPAPNPTPGPNPSLNVSWLSSPADSDALADKLTKRSKTDNLWPTIRKIAEIVFDQTLGVSEAYAQTAPLPAPVLMAAVGKDTEVKLFWSPVTGATRYWIFYGTSSGAYSREVNLNNVTNCTVTGLSNGTKYFFVVQALNAAGLKSVNSNELSATPQVMTPPAPVLNSATAGNAKVTLAWNASHSATSYSVKYGTVRGTYGTSINVGNVNSYTVSGLTNGTVYYFVVTATNVTGTSPNSNEIGAIPKAAVPSAPTLNSASAGSAKVTLGWSAVSGATGYSIKYGTASRTYTTTINSGNVTSYVVLGLTNGTKYYFVVTARNAAGSSGNSNERSATPIAPQTAGFIDNVTYNASGQTTKIEYGNGDVTTYTYDLLNLRLTRIFSVNQAGYILQDLRYTYDSTGNIISIVDGVNTASQSFTYDALNRLKQAQGNYGTRIYAYDTIGNLLQKDGVTYIYGGNGAGPHQVTAGSDGTVFSYDANGNMIRMTKGPVSTEYVYDVENRLKAVKKNSTTIAEYSYDGDGGRTKKVAGSQASGGLATRYVGSMYEVQGAEKIEHIFLGDARVASLRNGLESYFHGDHLGSTNVATDPNGTQVQLLEYVPFGGIARSVGTDSTAYKFTGKPLDDESGLYYYGAMYYDPAVGRFLTPDTIVQDPYNPQSLNRYSYCLNNPINRIDPSGNWSWKKFWNSFAGAAVGAVVTVLTGGLGTPLWIAGMAGGMAGGALTGGLEGGWKGALIGAGTGGALGALGGWGVSSFGWGFGAGMLVAGAGVAGDANSWDSFAGGVTGGVTGWLAGAGINDAYHKNLAFADPEGGVRNTDVAEGRGVGTTPTKALKVANETGNRVLYTPSRNVASDLVRGGTQLLFRNSLASKDFAQYVLSHPETTTYNLHSEMTLTALGAAEMIVASGGKAAGVHFNLVSPFYSEATANSVFGAIGATIKYFPPNLADSAGMFATFTPVTAPIYGTLGILTLEHFHSYEVYKP